MPGKPGPGRRTVAAGLAGALLSPALLSPSLAFAQHEPPRVVPLDPAVSPAPAGDEEAVDAARDLADRMTVPVTLNGAGPFPFVIDTGSNRTVISEVLAARLGLPAGGDLKVRTATGVVTSTGVTRTSLVAS